MKKGACLGCLALIAAALCGPRYAGAQSTGLGAGSRASAADSAEDNRSGWGEDGSSSPRRAQMNKRLGLSARRSQAFDPKIYEARGRELQGQFYEIGTIADPKRDGTSKRSPTPEEAAYRRSGRTQWMFWAGIAGVAGASAGVAGYLLLQNSHPTAPPAKHIVLTDE